MEVVEGRTIEGESVLLDGKHFVNCTLIHCVLEYHGADVIFERTVMRGCSHVFYGQARRVVHYLQEVGLVTHQPEEWAEFPQLVH